MTLHIHIDKTTSPDLQFAREGYEAGGWKGIAAGAALAARGYLSGVARAPRNENLREHRVSHARQTDHAATISTQDKMMIPKSALRSKGDTRERSHQQLGSSVVPGLGGLSLSAPTPTWATYSFYPNSTMGFTTWTSGSTLSTYNIWGNNPTGGGGSGTLMAQGQIRCKQLSCSFINRIGGPPGIGFISYGLQILESGTYRFRQYIRFPNAIAGAVSQPAGSPPPTVGMTMFFYLMTATTHVDVTSWISAPSNMLGLDYDFTGSGTDSFHFDANGSCNGEVILQVKAGQTFATLFTISCLRASATVPYFNPTIQTVFQEDLLVVERLPCVAWL